MKTPELKQTPFSKVVCSLCKSEFTFPYDGDMNYGELYFKGEQGTAFGFYEPLSHPLWEYVEKTINDNTTEELDSDKDHNVGARLQWVIAQCADPIDNQKLTPDITCPQCKSFDIYKFELYHDEFVEYRDIPRISFHQFQSLSEKTKVEKILNLYCTSLERYPPLHYSRSILGKTVDFLGYILFSPVRWFVNLKEKNA